MVGNASYEQDGFLAGGDVDHPRVILSYMAHTGDNQAEKTEDMLQVLHTPTDTEFEIYTIAIVLK